MIVSADAVFLDTNVLVYATVAESPWHEAASQAIQIRQDAGIELWISRQIIREYLSAMTRPQAFPQPVPVANLVRETRLLESRFRIAEDSSDVTARLLDLVEWIPTGGAQIHDANIIATMQTYGVHNLLTHNIADFARFAHLVVVIPLLEP